MADVQLNAPVEMTPEIVRAVVKDKELRSLRPGSEAYQAAFTKKFGEGNDTKKTDSADVTATESKTKTEVSGEEKTKTSAQENETERSELSKKAQRRFDKLNAEKKSLEARIAELEAAGRSPKQAEKQAERETTQATGAEFTKARPKIEDFQGKSIAEFQEALMDWKLEKKDFEKDQSARTKADTESANKSLDEFFKSGKQLEKEMGLSEGDFEALINDPDGAKTYPSTKKEIIESPYGAQIALEIANADEALKERISKMSPTQQLTFIGKLEAKFESKKQSSKENSTNISQAKPPGKSLQKGTSGPTTGIVPSPKDFKAYEAWRKEQRPEKFKR